MLQPDTAGETLLVLRQIAYQTAANGLSPGMVPNVTAFPPSPLSAFEPSLTGIYVNALWFASLTCSIATASIGILVKQWLREYMACRLTTSAQGRLRIRNFRSPGLETWKVFEIAASLPLLIQLALALFFAGLCFFTADANPSVGHVTLPLVVAWALFFFIVTICPVFSARCPYKTPLFVKFLNAVRDRLYSRLKRMCWHLYSSESMGTVGLDALFCAAHHWVEKRTS